MCDQAKRRLFERYSGHGRDRRLGGGKGIGAARPVPMTRLMEARTKLRRQGRRTGMGTLLGDVGIIAACPTYLSKTYPKRMKRRARVQVIIRNYLLNAENLEGGTMHCVCGRGAVQTH